MTDRHYEQIEIGDSRVTFMREKDLFPFPKIFSFFQFSLCTSNQCANKLKYDDTKCLKNCEGMQVTTYSEKSISEVSLKVKKLSNKYNAYKGVYKFPRKYKGKDQTKSI